MHLTRRDVLWGTGSALVAGSVPAAAPGLTALVEHHTALTPLAGALAGVCPFCGDLRLTLRVWPDAGRFRCRSCKQEGDEATFRALLQAVDGAEPLATPGAPWADLLIPSTAELARLCTRYASASPWGWGRPLQHGHLRSAAVALVLGEAGQLSALGDAVAAWRGRVPLVLACVQGLGPDVRQGLALSASLGAPVWTTRGGVEDVLQAAAAEWAWPLSQRGLVSTQLGDLVKLWRPPSFGVGHQWRGRGSLPASVRALLDSPRLRGCHLLHPTGAGRVGPLFGEVLERVSPDTELGLSSCPPAGPGLEAHALTVLWGGRAGGAPGRSRLLVRDGPGAGVSQVFVRGRCPARGGA